MIPHGADSQGEPKDSAPQSGEARDHTRWSFGQNLISDATPPETLYHYTTHAGLLGILSSKVLWATNIHYLNDSSEFRHDVHIAQDHARVAIPSDLTTLISEMNEMMHMLETARMYVFSLSEERDLLSQWRAYCALGGVAIGFSSAQLLPLIGLEKFFLTRCNYDEASHGRITRILVDQALNTYRTALLDTSLDDEARLRTVVRTFLPSLGTFAASIKHPTFSEEREWRLVSSTPVQPGDRRLNVRAGKSLLLPYMEVSINNLEAITEVVLAPGPNADLALEATTMLFEKHHLSVRCRRSRVPYRSL